MLSPNTTRQPIPREEAEAVNDTSSALKASRSPAETEEVLRIATNASSTPSDKHSASLKLDIKVTAGLGRDNSGGADYAGGGTREGVLSSIEGDVSDDSISAEKEKETRERSAAATSTFVCEATATTAGTQEGGAHSPPFRFLPPTPPQALYPSSRPSRRKTIGSVMGVDGNSRIEGSERGRPGDDRTAVRSGDRSGKRLAAQSGPFSGDSVGRRLPVAGGRVRAGMRAGSVGKEGEMGRKRLEGKEEDAGQGNGRVAQIAEGLLWVQKHPVLAAVIWMFGKVLAPGTDEDKAREDEAKSPTTGQGTSKNRPGSPEGRVSPSSGDREDDSRLWSLGGASSWEDLDDSQGNVDERRALWRSKANSKGRLSWSDDYGGSLAEYYEDERVRVVSDATSAGDASDPTKIGNITGKSSPLASGDVAGGCWPSHSKLSTGGQSPNSVCVKRRGDAEKRNGAHVGEAPPGADRNSRCQPEVRHRKERDNKCRNLSEEEPYEHSAEGCEPDGEEEAGLGDTGVALRALNFAKGPGSRILEVGRGMGSGEMEMRDGWQQDGNGAGSLGFERHEDVFYEDMSDAMRGGTEQTDGAGCPARATVSPKDGRVVSNGFSVERNADGDAGFLPRTTTSPGGGSGGGTPHSGAPGTWSPQWGWYVSMTPPQDLYPTPQTPVTGARTAAASNEPVDTQTSLRGRPPRP